MNDKPEFAADYCWEIALPLAILGKVMESQKKKVEWGPCCFCALDIPEGTTDPCRITVETKTGDWQVWFCHAKCFKDRLSTRPDLMGMFDPAHF